MLGLYPFRLSALAAAATAAPAAELVGELMVIRQPAARTGCAGQPGGSTRGSPASAGPPLVLLTRDGGWVVRASSRTPASRSRARLRRTAGPQPPNRRTRPPPRATAADSRPQRQASGVATI